MTKILCGFLHVDEVMLHPLLARMPSMLRVRPGDTFPRLQAIIRYTLDEARSERPGDACMLTRLSEIMFVEILRQFIEEQPEDAWGPLASLRDPLVGRALALIHGNPARDWTVETLAQEAAVSRSVLAERFAALMGCPPIAYLSHWRIQLASHRLRESEALTAAIAAEVGYQSEPAFNKAFKRRVGEPPAAWRRRQKQAAAIAN